MTKFNFPESEIRVLTDDTPATLPTRANIVAALAWLLDGAAAGDLLVVHYSGHGSYVRDLTGDESDARDEVWVPLDFETAGMLNDDWIRTELVQRVPQGVRLRVFSDSCHSGTMCDLRYNFRSACRFRVGRPPANGPYVAAQWTDQFTTSLERISDTVGDVWMLSAAYDNQYAMDAVINNLAQGAFTYCLGEALQNWVPGTTARQLLKEVNARLQLAGFRGQQSQLSMGRDAQLDRVWEW